MKKIKLITPILGLATISSSLIPLCSCNKNSGEMTAEQWHKAFEDIKNPYSTSRDFTASGKLTYYDETVEPENKYFEAKCKGTTIDSWFKETDDEGKEKTDPYYSILSDDNVVWELSYDTDDKPRLGAAVTSLTYLFFSLIGGIFDSLFDSGITKIKDSVYRAYVLDVEGYKMYCDFTFDEQKKITNVTAKLVSTTSGKETVLKEGSVDFKDYGSTKIDKAAIEKKYTDEAKIGNHIIDAVLSGSTYVATAKETLGNQLNFKMPATLSLSNLNTIKVTQGTALEQNYSLFLNGKLLVEDADYVVKEYEGEEEEPKDPKTIQLNNPLKANDKLIVIGEAIDETKTLIVELSEAA